jgi:hypothetical protein
MYKPRFQLTKEEKEELVANCDRFESGGYCMVAALEAGRPGMLFLCPYIFISTPVQNSKKLKFQSNYTNIFEFKNSIFSKTAPKFIKFAKA